jgi:hypothetical protein
MAVTKTKKRSSNRDTAAHIVVTMGDLLKKKKQPSKEDRMTRESAVLAAKILGFDRVNIPSLNETIDLPGKQRQPSKKLQQIIGTIGSTFMKLEDSINEALGLGRAEGFSDMEIGNMIRAEFKRLNRPRMTLSRYLPATAKYLEKARPKPNKSESGNKMLPNRPSTTNKTLPSSTTTTIQHEQPQRWDIDPKEYEIKHVKEYDRDLLVKIVHWLHKTKDEIIHELTVQVKELKKENELLKSADNRLPVEVDLENQRLDAENKGLRAALE